MNIAIFTDLYTPGGATGGVISSIRAQKADLEKLGHQVTIFCPGLETDEENVVLVPTFKFPRINGALISRGPKTIVKFIHENFPDFSKFDIIHVQYEASCSIAGILLAKEFNLPLVQTMHGREDMAIAINIPHGMRLFVATALEKLHNHYLKHAISVKQDNYQAPNLVRAKMWQLMVNHAQCADIVTTPSRHFAKKLEHYGVTRPIIVVPNGLPDDFVKTNFPPREYHNGETLKLIWNSRVSAEKRFLPFLEALRELHYPYILYVFGDGNELGKAKKYVKKYQMPVEFFGARPREEIIAKMQDCHLGISASYNFDTQGMVLIEAEATGLPVFLCDPDLVESLPSGGYILSKGPEASKMAAALNALHPRDIEKMSKIMLAHRHETAQSAQIDKLLGAYRRAINSQK